LNRPGRNRSAFLAAAVISLAALVAACGSSGSSNSSSTGSPSPGAASTAASTSAASSGDAGVAHAKAALQAASAIPAFKLKAPAFDMSKIKGKVIFSIPLTSAIPYVVDVDKQGADIAKKYGARWVEYTNQGTPTEWTAGINQAINTKADLIILGAGIPDVLLLGPLKKAKAAGIPVLIVHTHQNGQLDAAPPNGPGPEVTAVTKAFVTTPFWEAGRLEVDQAIADTNGHANVLIFTTAEVPMSDGIVAAEKEEFKTYCPGCTYKVLNVSAAEWASKIAPETQSALQQNPGINWVLPLYDSMSLFVAQGITAAGKSGSVQIASYNGTPAVMKLIQDGKVMAMDVGENIAWLGYSEMDQAGRILTGADPIADGNEMTPLRVFTKDNIDETGTPPTPDKGYGDAYVSGYGALWSGK
jgi:ribose transport system substrate-binding protein